MSFTASLQPTKDHSFLQGHFLEPLEYAFGYIIVTGIAYLFNSAVAIPLASISLTTYLGGVAVKFSEKYDIYLLKATMAKCCKLAERYPVLKTAVLVASIAAGFWIPIPAAIVVMPIAFINIVHKMQSSHKKNQ